MIPPVINYCWFGGKELPENAKKCIESWKRFCPNYEIKRWDESNFDYSSSYYSEEAYELKKWAFVSDYARLKIIYENGGIYLDVDVEVIRPLDELLNEKCYLGTENNGTIATGLGFGAEKKNNSVLAMLNEYNGIHFFGKNKIIDNTPCPKRNTAPFQRRGFVFSTREIWNDDDVTVFPPEYFCPKDYLTGEIKMTSNTFTIHHYTSLWVTKEDEEIGQTISRIFKENPRLIGEIKKQRYLYMINKRENPNLSFASYLIEKMQLKIMNRK